LRRCRVAADDKVCAACDGTFEDRVIVGVILDDVEVVDCADYLAELLQATADTVGVGAWKLELASQLLVKFVEECR
jgi:hypothetical protein